ncbi:hypothetical protein AMS68_006262 [Peltaster fructicola]|uniref:1,3-beta-glucanosyltransferase n=1 Tax=Peltaster fructicola TaxID=286661 RepID=A0A6H0Y1F7_9PEZI|nr:hypothetical protein AMS68_006262 [Peltaster fructicola]
MRGLSIGAAVAASSLFVSSALAAVDPIVIKGSKFFYKTNGTEFFIRGVAYQQDYNGGGADGTVVDSTNYNDPLADTTACQRDIPYLVALRTNVIRTYAIDPSKDHSTCMNALANAGIYVIADLASPSQSINRDSPAWNDDLYTRYTSVIDNMASYTNTLGFFAGNEVSNNASNTGASAFVRAAVRDMKTYISAKGYRTIGVGYAADDDATIRAYTSDYFNCGDQSSAIDFWGYNIYEWCGTGKTFQSSGYADRTAEFANFSVPAFFAEYGCINPRPRTFDDTPVLYSDKMDGVWSGGIVYMYFQETNDYGLVSIGSDSSVTTLSDYSVLSSQIATVSPSGPNSASYTTSNSPRACPTIDSTWKAAASPLPPTPDSGVCQCMYDSLSCVVGSGVSTKSYGDLFSYVCGQDANACKGIATVPANGTYGAYSMCNSTQQLAFVLNQYYLDQGSQASACSFGGSATLKSATSPTGSCSTAIAAAGSNGAGTLGLGCCQHWKVWLQL